MVKTKTTRPEAALVQGSFPDLDPICLVTQLQGLYYFGEGKHHHPQRQGTTAWNHSGTVHN